MESLRQMLRGGEKSRSLVGHTAASVGMTALFLGLQVALAQYSDVVGDVSRNDEG
jgi:hypothetical protein